MSALTWVLAGFLAFWLGAAILRARGALPESVRVYGPLVSIHTKRGREFLDRLARPRRFWRAWGNFGLGVALVVMAGALLALAFAVVALLQNPPPETSPLNQPRNALVIPGVNQFLPLSVAPEILLGLAIALVVHEGGHGILCRVEDIDIESLGLLFITVFPAGAFVQPDEEGQRAADRGARSRMFAAGVTNNFAVTILAFVLLFGPVVGSIGVVQGAMVGGALPGSSAQAAGIDRGDVIVGVENQTVTSNDDLQHVLDEVEAARVTVDFRSGPPVEVNRSVLITGVVRDGPISLSPNATIVAVNGTEVGTTATLRDALENRTVATLRTANGDETTAPMGAYVGVAPDGPLAAAGAPNGSVVVARIDGNRTVTLDDLKAALDGRDPGDTLRVTLYDGGRRHTLNVTLAENPHRPDEGYLGVYLSAPGISGMTVSDFGVETYPAGRYLGLLGGSCEGCGALGEIPFGVRLYFIFSLPLIGVASIPTFPYNFAGFVGPITNFFVVGGPLGWLGGGVFLLANLLFWTAWINLNLAFFNCIPTFLLDGGHIMRAAVESVVAHLPVERGRELVTATTVSVQLLMLGSLLLLLFGAQLLN